MKSCSHLQSGPTSHQPPQAPVAVPCSAASFPDGPGQASASPGRSTAMDDLLGLESEISAIQAGIQQIDKITPTPPMSFQTESMMPLNLDGSALGQVISKFSYSFSLCN